jgi:GntP family gluconate:H+ symporter
MRQRGLSLVALASRMGPPIETAGLIILITSAGGAFGAMLAQAGIGRAIETAVAGGSVNLILLGWLVGMVIRVAQGSVTTAMITAAAIMAPLAGNGLRVHPVYLFMAVGYGALFVSWMNDSGFWVISRVGGLTERETLASWTALSGVLSLAGLAMTYLLSVFFPMVSK